MIRNIKSVFKSIHCLNVEITEENKNDLEENKNDLEENKNDLEEDILDQVDIPWLSFKGIFTRCKVCDVYDADTITIIIPFCNEVFRVKCRLSGIDSPEIRTKDLEEKKAGYEARDWLRERILNKKLWIDCDKFDKYGRLLGILYQDENKEENINLQIIKEGHATFYDGKKKVTWREWKNLK